MKLSKLGFVLLKDKRIKEAVCQACDIKINALYYWIKQNDIRLTAMPVLDAISRVGGVTIEQLIEADCKDTATAA